MAEGHLSQDEIDALLAGIGGPAGAAPGAAPAAAPRKAGAAGLDGRVLKAAQRAASVLGTLLSRKIAVSAAGPAREGGAEVWKEVAAGDAAVFETELTGRVAGPAAWALSKGAAAAVADLMMGNDGSKPPADLDELYQSAVREAISQGISAMANALAEEVGGPVSPTPPEMRLIDPAENPPLAAAGGIAVVPLRISIEGVVEGSLAIGFAAAAAEAIAGAAGAPAPGASVAAAGPAGTGQAVGGGPVTYQSVQFPSLQPGVGAAPPRNIDLILDVPMQLTVELGRTSMFIKDILDLGTGSIIELDKLAGEPVDLLINGKLVARGEVVVIDENFGVRVTDIISPMERIKSLQ